MRIPGQLVVADKLKLAIRYTAAHQGVPYITIKRRVIQLNEDQDNDGYSSDDVCTIENALPYTHCSPCEDVVREGSI